MASEKTFPILRPYAERKWLIEQAAPTRVPWSFIELHRKQLWSNHGQTLEGLAGRGGLSVSEMVCAAEGSNWFRMPQYQDTRNALPRLLKLLAAHESGEQAPTEETPESGQSIIDDSDSCHECDDSRMSVTGGPCLGCLGLHRVPGPRAPTEETE